MYILKMGLALVSVFTLFLNPAKASSMADGNASIGCNLQHGTDYKEQQEAEDIVAYVTNIRQSEALENEAETIE